MTTDTHRAVAAEAIGTALLVAAVVGSGIMGQRLSGGNTAIALLANTLATAAMLFVLVTILGPVSGAHFNPVVSLIMRLRGALPSDWLLPFCLAQVAGGIAGTWAAHAMFDMSLLQFSTTVRGGPAQWWSEVVATFALLGAILGGLRYAPHAIAMLVALVITSAYWMTASTSFANPAVTIARALSDTFAGIAPASVPGFIAAQVVGALAGHAFWSWLHRQS